MHVEPPQPRIVQRLREFRQQHAVGGQRQVLNPRNRRQPPDQHRQIAPHQRLSAGDPQLADPQPDRDPHEPFDLFEVQNLAALHEMHARLRHAVKAADIAAVGDADAQVVVHAAEGIDQWSSVHYFTASMRSSGTSARRITSADKFHARLQVAQAVAQFLERVHLHVRALAAIAVFVGHEVELFPGRQLAQRMIARRSRSSR